MRKLIFLIIFFQCSDIFCQRHELNVGYNFGPTGKRIETSYSVPGLDWRNLYWVNGLEIGINSKIKNRIEAGVTTGFNVGYLSLLITQSGNAINRIFYYSIGLNLKFNLKVSEKKRYYPFLYIEGQRIFHFPKLLHIDNAEYSNLSLLNPGIGYHIMLSKVSALELLFKKGITSYLISYNFKL